MGVEVATAAECMTERRATVEGGPVHIDVAGTEIERGHVSLFLSRRMSDAWRRAFWAETCAADFIERLPDEWKHKGRGASDGLWTFDDDISVRDAPLDAASFRQLMCAVRDAMARTNAAEPSDDPPTADASLNVVLDEVFGVDSSG